MVIYIKDLVENISGFVGYRSGNGLYRIGSPTNLIKSTGGYFIDDDGCQVDLSDIDYVPRSDIYNYMDELMIPRSMLEAGTFTRYSTIDPKVLEYVKMFYAWMLHDRFSKKEKAFICKYGLYMHGSIENIDSGAELVRTAFGNLNTGLVNKIDTIMDQFYINTMYRLRHSTNFTITATPYILNLIPNESIGEMAIDMLLEQHTNTQTLTKENDTALHEIYLYEKRQYGRK